MRLPNGYGGITKLPGNRRKPYRARKTTGWIIEDGKCKQQYITIGYFATKKEALQALTEYNTNPYDINVNKITFAEVYEKWSERKFENISQSNINGYKASYKVCTTLYDMPFHEIKLNHLQSVVDNSGKGYDSRKKLRILFNQLFDYAVQNEIIGKDKQIVEYVDIGKPERSTKHYRFSHSEIEALWRWADKNEYIQVILMLIYSGCRPGELFSVKSKDVDIETGYFNVRQGKNDNAIRKVPIHKDTVKFYKHWLDKGNEYLITQLNGKPIKFDTNHGQFTESYWIPILKDIGILQYKNDDGELCQHLPHDTRHTFTSMWAEKHLDEGMRRKIQGHSGKGIGEIVYTHLEIQTLKAELDKL